MTGGERKILEFVINAYPELVDREELSEATGYKRSARDTYIQRLKARKLLRTVDGGLEASAELFD